LAGGGGYSTPPEIIFTRDTNLIREARVRQSLNAVTYNLTGITTNLTSSQTEIPVETTSPFPGSGKILLGRELVRYTGRTQKGVDGATYDAFTGCDRGINFRFDQKVILDNLQDDPNTGLTAYNFSVTDKVRRVVESSNNRVAIVYDWDEAQRALYLTFEVDELAFIDGGRSNEKAKNIAFVAGTSGSSGTGIEPHILVEKEGSDIVTFTSPLGLILNRAFEDDDEEYTDSEGIQRFGDGIIDLVNTGTDFENQINLDGGIAPSKYGIEETLGGTNTTLLQIGDQIYDGSQNALVATVQSAGQLGDGDTHVALATIIIEYTTSVLHRVAPAEEVEGVTTGVKAQTVSRTPGPKNGQYTLNVESLVNNGDTYKFNVGEVLRGNASGGLANIKSVEYNAFARNEGE